MKEVSCNSKLNATLFMITFQTAPVNCLMVYDIINYNDITTASSSYEENKY